MLILTEIFSSLIKFCIFSIDRNCTMHLSTHYHKFFTKNIKIYILLKSFYKENFEQCSKEFYKVFLNIVNFFFNIFISECLLLEEK